MKIDFKGKTVIITGGASGIGASISTEFAAAGANVVIDYLPVKSDIEGLAQITALMKKNSWSYQSFAGDVTSASDMEKLFSLAKSHFGSVDVVVNSAGFTESIPVEKLPLELWEKGIQVNLTGAFIVTQAAIKYMLPRGKGKIIYIGSAGSITGGGGAAFYSAAKAGINGLVRNLSKELSPKGITVNAILPALIKTNLLIHRIQEDPAKEKECLSRIPLGRLGKPEDVAYLTLFLASDYAEFICGQLIVIDGGCTYK
jgi:3-oxoacyl-[acyl-carrier protein] reductase